MRHLCLAVGILALATAGCGGSPTAKVKGQILENGQPKSFPPSSHAVEIAPISDAGVPDNSKMFTAVVNADGSFEVLASGGELPLGNYVFTVRGSSAGKKGTQPPGAKRELKSGLNTITLDVAKPGE